MNDPAISSIHHVTLNVQDPERSEQWYSQVLIGTVLKVQQGRGREDAPRGGFVRPS